jgi:hypothetical protein
MLVKEGNYYSIDIETLQDGNWNNRSLTMAVTNGEVIEIPKSLYNIIKSQNNYGNKVAEITTLVVSDKFYNKLKDNQIIKLSNLPNSKEIYKNLYNTKKSNIDRIVVNGLVSDAGCNAGLMLAGVNPNPLSVVLPMVITGIQAIDESNDDMGISFKNVYIYKNLDKEDIKGVYLPRKMPISGKELITNFLISVELGYITGEISETLNHHHKQPQSQNQNNNPSPNPSPQPPGNGGGNPVQTSTNTGGSPSTNTNNVPSFSELGQTGDDIMNIYP